MKDYLEAIAGTGIKNAVYMEVDVDPSQQQAEAEYLMEICKSGRARPSQRSCRVGRPAMDLQSTSRSSKEVPISRASARCFTAARTPAGYCLEEAFVRGIRLLGELGLSFDLCLRPKELSDGARLAEQCPETRFIVDHCGNADPKAFFKAGDSRLADASPITTPILAARHGTTGGAKKRDLQDQRHRGAACRSNGRPTICAIVNHCLDTFGPQRVVFGSDWPVCLNGAPLRNRVAASSRSSPFGLLPNSGNCSATMPLVLWTASLIGARTVLLFESASNFFSALRQYGRS